MKKSQTLEATLPKMNGGSFFTPISSSQHLVQLLTENRLETLVRKTVLLWVDAGWKPVRAAHSLPSAAGQRRENVMKSS